MSTLATLTGTVFTAKFDFPSGYFMLPFLMLTSEVYIILNNMYR